MDANFSSLIRFKCILHDYLPSNAGTNNCWSLLALKISEKWYLEIKSIRSHRKRFVGFVEDISQISNPFRDI